MREAIRLPLLGSGMERGSVVQWLKRPGDAVRRDEPLAILLLDKVEFKLASPAEGMLVEICVPPGQECAVGQILGRIEPEPGGSTPSAAVT